MSAARTDPDLPARIVDWISDGALADLGYEGEFEIFTIPFKKPQHGQLAIDQQTYNTLHSGLRFSAKAPTHCSRPPTRPCATTAAVKGLWKSGDTPLRLHRQ